MRPNWFSSALERRNFSMLTLDGALYNAALTILDATILIPLFLEHVGGSPMLIGLSIAIRQLGFILPQIFMAQWMYRIPRLDRFVFWTYLICRFAFLFLPFVLVESPSSQAVLLTFFIGYTLFSLGEGIIQVPWMDLFGRTIRTENHGRLFGLMQSLGAVGSFGCGLVIQQVLAHPERYPYPSNFFIFFSLAFAVLFLSTLSFLCVKDRPRRKVSVPESSWSATLRGLPRTWKHNRAFRTLLIVQTLVGMHQLVMPFYILYVQGLQGIGLSFIGTLVMAQVVGGIVSGLLIGWFSAQYGNRKAIQFTALINVLVPLLILLAGMGKTAEQVRAYVLLAFVMLGVVGGSWIGFTNYLLEICTDETRGRFVAYLNMCSAPVAVLPVFSAGLTVIFSYPSLFVFVLILLLVAFFWSFRLPPASTTTRYRRGDRAARPDRQTNAAPQ